MSVFFNANTFDCLHSTASMTVTTVSLWFKPTDPTSANQTLFIRRNAAGPLTDWKHLKLNSTSSGVLGQVTAEMDTTLGAASPVHAGPIRWHQWNHVVVVFATITKLSLNGAPFVTGTGLSGTYAWTMFGGLATASVATNRYTGLMGEAAVFYYDMDSDPDTGGGTVGGRIALANGFRQMLSRLAGPLAITNYWSFRHDSPAQSTPLLVDTIGLDALTVNGFLKLSPDDPPMVPDFTQDRRTAISKSIVAAGRRVSLGGYYKQQSRTVLVG